MKMSQQYPSPDINFRGRAREALGFYHKVLGGWLTDKFSINWMVRLDKA
jgi:uncharacterized glyoxalase superfamily protein PhnB